MRKVGSFLFSIVFLFASPLFASAHEVYVLGKGTVAPDVAMQSPNPFSMVMPHQFEFFLWAFISIIVVVGVLLISTTQSVGRMIDPFLMRIKKYAPLIARVTIGICFFASAYFQALFGPELPFSDFAGTFAPTLVFIFYALGICFLLGIYARPAALLALGIFFLAVFQYGVYMLTYLNYVGAILVVFLLGAGMYSFDARFKKKMAASYARIEPYAFLIIRVCFGISVLFASFYAKFWHSQLALDTVVNYHLTNYFYFEPLFIVLGAFIIESLIGIFFIIGFEVRFTAFFFIFFLFLSFIYFGEVVWPHIVLLGLNLALIAHGYDRFTVGALLGKKTHLEPVL